MKTLNKIIEEELINEMPYLVIDKNKHFDLELEKFYKTKDFEGFLTHIKTILKGQEQIDKYNNKANIQTSEEKQKFKNSLKGDISMPLALWRLFIHWLDNQ